MPDRVTWAKRVAEWRARRLGSPAFCAGKNFTAGGLRHWAHRLRHGEQRRAGVRLAKVVALEIGELTVPPPLPTPAEQVAPD